MKIFTNYIIFASFLLLFVACGDEDIKLYHEKEIPKHYWLLDSVQYPEQSLGLSVRKSFSFVYTEDNSVQEIERKGQEKMSVTYKDNWVIYSQKRSFSNSNSIDSIFVKLDANKRALYALHASYTERLQENDEWVLNSFVPDSSYFKYDAAGYLIQVNRYQNSKPQSTLTYSETRTIVGGNISEIVTSRGYRYFYTYDESDYIPSSEYTYEMTNNTFSLYGGGCLTLTNLIFYNQYLGKGNTNNTKQITIKEVREDRTIDYADLRFDYTLNENNLLKSIKMSGMVKGEPIPENYITSLTYLKKEK